LTRTDFFSPVKPDDILFLFFLIPEPSQKRIKPDQDMFEWYCLSHLYTIPFFIILLISYSIAFFNNGGVKKEKQN